MSCHSNRRVSRRSAVSLGLGLLLTACGKSTPAAPPPTLAPTPTEVPRDEVGQLTLVEGLRLDRQRAVGGETIVGRVVYQNAQATPVTVENLQIIARRDPAGEEAPLQFNPGLGRVTVAPGARVTLVATHIVAGTIPGEWTAESRYQDRAGIWHDAPREAAIAFTIVRPAPPIGGATPAARPTRGTPPPALAVAQLLEQRTPLYWGAYIEGVPWDLAKLDAFEARARKRASLIHWGQPWWRDGQYQPFYPTDFARARSRGAIPFLDWGSWDYTAGPQQPRFALAAIARGDHDPHIRAWAAGAAAWGKPLFLRFNWEMNGWWQFPWAEQLNGNRPGDFAAAWRHVHDLFLAEGAANVSWVWCVNAINGATTPLDGLYPGDRYVDWVAMDGYNWGTAYGNRWQTFAEVFGPTYAELRRLAPMKPIMIAEIGCQESGGDKAAWIADALGVQLPTRFPAIKAVAWFNWNDNDPMQTAPIESSAAATAAFGAAIGGNPAYLPNDFADLETSPIPIHPPAGP